MNKELAAAIAIYEELGWDKATPDQALTLPLGTKEQQRIAKKGLSVGSIEQAALTREMLSLFAIRLGVKPQRIIGWWNRTDPAIMSAAVVEQGPQWATEFIERACHNDFRILEHSVSLYGTVIVDAVTRLNLPIPESVEYLKDWAAITAGHLRSYKAPRLVKQITERDALRPKFNEHLKLTMTLGVPASGPLGALVPGAVEHGWLGRDEALNFAFEWITFASRPIDRKIWTRVLTQDLQVTDEELLAHKEALIPVISTAEAPVVENLGLRLLPHLEGQEWVELAEILLYVPTAKALTLVLKAIADAPVPSPDLVESLVPQVAALASHKSDKVAALSKALLDSWGFAAKAQESGADTPLYEWRAYPGFQESLRVHLPENISPETITPLLAEFSFQGGEHPLEAELLWAQLVELTKTDVDAARRSVAGVTGYPILRQWSRGTTVEDPTVYPENYRYPITSVPARNADLLQVLGDKQIPCLLSQPSFEDQSIDPEDLLLRLHRYQDAGAEILVSDLLLALARLRVPAEPGDLQERCAGVTLSVEGMKHNVGQIVAAYLADPFKDPGCKQERGILRPKRLKIPASVKELVDLEYKRFHNWHIIYNDPSTFPGFRKSVWTYVNPDPSFLAALARSGFPMEPVVATEFLIMGEETTEYASALAMAWSRGLIKPGQWQFQSDDIDNYLVEALRSLRIAAEVGALAAAWSLLDHILAYHATRPRVRAGVTDLVLLAKEFAPSVAAALKEGAASAPDVPVAGLCAMAGRSGSSKAVRYAKEALALLPDDVSNTAQPAPAAPAMMSKQEFARLWPSRNIPENPADGFTISFRLVGEDNKALDTQINLTKAGASYTITPAGWFYGLAHEGQVEALTPDGKTMWLHWDEAKGDLVETEYRNWADNNYSVLDGPATPLSVSLVAVLVISLQSAVVSDNCKYELEEAISERMIHPTAVDTALKAMMNSPDYNPTKSLGFLEKTPQILHVLWPILTNTLSFAARQETPPRWASRCLDAISANAPLLLTATAQGHIPPSAWEPLATLAAARKKSAARTKAQDLVKIFLGE